MGRFMKMLALAGMATLLLALPGLAQAQTIERIELLEYGLIAATVTSRHSAPGTASGQEGVLDQIAFTEKTTRVPARLGTRFGIRFRPPVGQSISLEQRWHLPAPGLRNPQTGNVYRQTTFPIEAVIGDDGVRAYAFDEEWELVPGDWTLEIWSGQRKLLSQTFTVFRPQ
jgi:hypothetical protein